MKEDYRVQYRNNMKYSYMILIADEHRCDADRKIVQSMSAAGIPGLLPMKIMPLDSSITYWYNVTGLVRFPDHLGENRISGRLLSLFLSSVRRLHENLLRYYLDERHLVMDFDKIYIREETMEFFFCYEPDHEGNISEELLRLAEKMIELADHQDEAAVAYAYGFYSQLSEKKGDIWGEAFDVARKYDLKQAQTNEVQELLKESTYIIEETKQEKEPEPVENGSRAFFLKTEALCDSIRKSFLRDLPGEIGKKIRDKAILKGGKKDGQNKFRLFKDEGYHF